MGERFGKCPKCGVYFELTGIDPGYRGPLKSSCHGEVLVSEDGNPIVMDEPPSPTPAEEGLSPADVGRDEESPSLGSVETEEVQAEDGPEHGRRSRHRRR